MEKKFVGQQKEKLLEKKKELENRLTAFAKRSETVKDDWVTSYPKFDGGGLEEEADEVEEYDNLLSVGYTLELELKKINEALARVKRGEYGICGKCKKPISKARLEVYPQAEYCQKCQ